MIQIILSNKAYENDVYPLAKAFYPDEIIKVIAKDDYDQGHFELKTTIDHNPIDHNTIYRMEVSKDNLGMIDIITKDTEIVITVSFLNGEEVRRKEYADILIKAQYKNSLKRLLYHILSDITQVQLPWGILTGIRPTKLVYEMLDEGRNEIDIIAHMKSEYLCSDQKISMSLQIAKRERELLSSIDYQNEYSLYIGIPFCPTTCLYCSFTSYSVTKYADYVEEYLKALEKEIEYAATCFPDKKLTSVYFGGGTPTTLTEKQLDRLLNKVREVFDFTYLREFTVEAGRPDSITREKLVVLKRYGVDRISINPQSMQQKTLDLIGRKHTVEQIKEAFQMARETGHTNINMDIIIGLPGENNEDVADTLRQIKELNPDSLTVHTLAVKRAARLNQEKNNYQELKAEDVPTMLDTTINFAKDQEYLPYYLYRQKNMSDNLENIGYSRYGKEGIYNILIMEEKQTILALGAGALSKFVFHKENRIERVDNVKSISDYVSRIDEMIQRKQQFLKDNII
ncbi:MAG: hypothetical protein K0S47_2689 [Herbinix sp.]|nr:hypothetical protein [Herbinix sp.]